MQHPQYPPTIVYGTEIPDLKLRWVRGTQIYFCRNNSNLRLTPEDFVEGTFEMGNLLGRLCAEHCAPHRGLKHQPCPAFVKSHKVGNEENEGLATVEMHPIPRWEECGGVRELLGVPQTREERFFLRAYLDDKYSDEAQWRDGLVEQWNASWREVPEGWAENSRRAKFDRMLWRTLRFPALIPQVWLNWLANASDEELKALDENPSRVDFLAFWRGRRSVVEIDGPSHYAHYDGTTYRVDERAYARNLKIERSLRRDGWGVMRIARVEVRDVMEDEAAAFLGAMALLRVLPFCASRRYPEPLSEADLGVPEIVPHAFAFDPDDIPF